jgi:hypothetical protein
MWCGSHSILWERFQLVILWLHRWNEKYRSNRTSLVQSIARISGRTIYDDKSIHPYWKLDDVLHMTRHACATNSRDKVFGILGLTEYAMFPVPLSSELVIDYTQPVSQVYSAATLYCIRETGSLRVLSQVESNRVTNYNSQDYKFPFWVPRWDQEPTVVRISTYSSPEKNATRNILLDRFNHASKNTQVMQDLSSPAGTLRLHGFRVDTVQTCLPMIPSGHTALKYSAFWTDQPWTQFYDMIANNYKVCIDKFPHRSRNVLDRAFLQVTTAGLTPEWNDAHNEPLIHFRAFLSWYEKKSLVLAANECAPNTIAAAVAASMNTVTMLPLLLPNQSKTEDLEPNCSPLNTADTSRYTYALNPSINRQIFITASGYLGLGPDGVMEDDIVVVLLGGHVPFVLRATDSNQWKLTGECYVHGIMNGEALEGEGADEDTHEWFELI